MNLRGQNQFIIRESTRLQVSFPATSRSTRTLLTYLFRPLQLLNLKEPIRVAQLKIPVTA
jgi:hypothetical protein